MNLKVISYKIINVKKDFKTISPLMFIVERDLKDKICNFNNLLLSISLLNTLVNFGMNIIIGIMLKANHNISVSGTNSLFCAYKVLYNSENHF